MAIPEFAANPFRLEKSVVSVWEAEPITIREKTKTKRRAAPKVSNRSLEFNRLAQSAGVD